MSLTLTDLVLFAAPLIIVYAIFLTFQSMEKEFDDSFEHEIENRRSQKQKLNEHTRGKYMLDQYVTIPNVLSLLRIILLVPILICFYSQLWLATLGFFIASAITDALDGIIARRWHMESHLGRMFDPLADKVTFVTLIALFGWSVLQRQMLLVLLAGELVLLFIGAYVYFKPRVQRRITLGVNMFGKIKTCCETLLVVLLIMWNFFAQPDIFYLHSILFLSICFALASIVRHVHTNPSSL